MNKVFFWELVLKSLSLEHCDICSFCSTLLFVFELTFLYMSALSSRSKDSLLFCMFAFFFCIWAYHKGSFLISGTHLFVAQLVNRSMTTNDSWCVKITASLNTWNGTKNDILNKSFMELLDLRWTKKNLHMFPKEVIEQEKI